MCLIIAAWHAHPDYPLVVAANRDEHFNRPTAAAHWWEDEPIILAGRDLSAMGTWLGIARDGRFAALTNYRDPTLKRTHAPSRGLLVRDALVSIAPTRKVLEHVASVASHYADFNLLVSDSRLLGIHESAASRTRVLGAGVHALSNHLLDTPWPKVEVARERFTAALEGGMADDDFLALLRDDAPAPDHKLPATGISLEWERMLSPVFVRAPGYGTRSSTLLMVRRDGAARLREWTWNEDAELAGEARHSFQVTLPRQDEDRDAAE